MSLTQTKTQTSHDELVLRPDPVRLPFPYILRLDDCRLSKKSSGQIIAVLIISKANFDSNKLNYTNTNQVRNRVPVVSSKV